MEPKECNNITCALVVVAKDEDKFLEEWINYYKNLGINKIFIGDNNLPEIPLKINDPKVEVIPFNSLDFIKTGYYNSQCFVYDTILNKIWDKFDYCLICDVDEFIEFKKHNTIQEFIQSSIIDPGYTVAEIWWETYDDNDLIHTQDKPVQSLYTRIQSKVDPYFTNMKKSIFKLCKGVRSQPHWPLPESMEEIGFKTIHIDPEIAVCKHYRTKCLEDYIKHKANNQSLSSKSSFGGGNILKGYFSINYITAEKLFWACKFVKDINWKLSEVDKKWVLDQFRLYPLVTVIIDLNNIQFKFIKLISNLNEIRGNGVNFLGIHDNTKNNLMAGEEEYLRKNHIPVLSVNPIREDLLSISKGLITTPHYIILNEHNFLGICRDLSRIYEFIIDCPYYLEGLLKNSIYIYDTKRI